MNKYELIVNIALKYIGSPYVWMGKGDLMWTPTGPAKNTFASTPFVFDCSGLIAHCIYKATGLDLRMTHNAQLMHDTFPIASGEPQLGDILLCGKSDETVTHVQFDLGRKMVCESAGGDSSTTTPQAAFARGAQVRAGTQIRSDIVATRRVPLDRSELRVI